MAGRFTALVSCCWEEEEEEDGGGGAAGGGIRSEMSGDSVALAAFRRTEDAEESREAAARNPCRRLVGKSPPSLMESVALWFDCFWSPLRRAARSCSGGGGSSLRDTDRDSGACWCADDLAVAAVDASAVVEDDCSPSGREGSAADLPPPMDRGSEE